MARCSRQHGRPLGLVAIGMLGLVTTFFAEPITVQAAPLPTLPKTAAHSSTSSRKGAAPASPTTTTTVAATTGTISGKVTAFAGGAGLPGICVYAYGPTGDSGGSTTGSKGTYSVSGLPAGSYTVEFYNGCGNSGDFVSQYYDDQTSQGSAKTVNVTVGATTSGIDDALVAGGAISGTVTAVASGAAVSGICVAALADGSQVGSVATTATDGTYSISGLSTGSYTVQFSTGCGNSDGFLAQYYDDQTSAASANAVSVTAGATSNGIDAALAAGGMITGTVTAAAGGAALSGICIYAYNSAGASAGATSASDGTYGLTGLGTGSYTVEFYPGCGNAGAYQTQYYDNQAIQTSANAVSVTAGATTSDIDDALAGGGTITGKVTAATGGAALSGICVAAAAAGSPVGSVATTASDGTYSIAGLPTGSYTVEFYGGCGTAGDYLAQYYNDQTSQGSADPVKVTAGGTTSGISDALAGAGTITGTVTAAAGGAATPGICVFAYASTGSLAGQATTASDGTYTISGLNTGSYTLEFSMGCGDTGDFLTQYYDNQTSPGSANPISVTAGASATGIDATLTAGGAITGTVTAAAGGAPLSGICVAATAGGLQVGTVATTALDGTYLISGLPSGTYAVQFSTGCGNVGNFLSQLYDDQTAQDSEQSVTVAAGVTTSGIDDALAAAGTITGKVTAAAGGKALPGICVYAYGSSGDNGEATTAPNGTYTIAGLPTDSYTLEFDTGCGNPGDYITQYYGSQSAQSPGQPVGVTAGETIKKIDAALASAGVITGTVSAADGGAPLSGICVNAYNSAGTSEGATTASDGSYSITSLAAGSYTVEFSTGCGNSGDFLTQYYDNQTSQTSANPVTVTAGETTTEIDGALAAGGTIAGTVTAASGGAALSGICVAVMTGGSQVGPAATTASNGTYQIAGLNTAAYMVQFSTGCGNSGDFLTQYYDNQTSQSSAKPVTVTAGETTTDIDDALAAGGTITGTVTAASRGAVLSGICVAAMTGGSQVGPAATTASNGTYRIAGLNTGSYTVQVSTGCGNSGGLLTQYYDDQTSAGSATPVSVTAGATTSGIDAALAAGGTITGTVIAASGGAPLSGICVYAYGSMGGSGDATTGTDGTYTISGLGADSYTVEFYVGCGNNGDFLTQYYDNQTSQASANPVRVTAGATTSGIGDAMVAGGAISGTVIAAAGGAALSGICVMAMASGSQVGPVATTASDGAYSITGLSAGSYSVEFYAGCGNSADLLTQYYDNQTSEASANPVSVTAGATTSGIDDALAAGGAITGTVTAAAGGAALSGICVTAMASGSQVGPVATTGSDGVYSITGLPAGSYTMEFYTGCGNTGDYLTQYYDNQTSEASAKPVSVTAGATTSGIGDGLAAGGTITGTVTAAAGGAAVSGICVAALADGSPVGLLATTASNGTYSITGLTSGSYTVEFSNGCGDTGDYLTQYYDNQTSQASAKPVSVVAGKTTGKIGDALAAAGPRR